MPFLVFLAQASRGVTPGRIAAAKNITPLVEPSKSGASASAGEATAYKWNVAEKGLPLLGLGHERLQTGFDQSLTYPANKFDFPIFKSLEFDEESGKYFMPAISRRDGNLISIEFSRTGKTNIYSSREGLELVDQGNQKTIRAADGTRFLFLQYPDGDLRCATIKENTGATLNLLYTANGLALHGVVDSSGRSLTFNYGGEGIRSLTQTWMANLEGFTRTWAIGDEDTGNGPSKFAHSVVRTGKFLPANALVRAYTAEMIACDRLLARLFGGPNAVAGGNGFEPAGLAASYPFYRGDVTGDDGRVRLGHLSHAVHLYGSPDGRGESALYVPSGFTSHSSEPTPTDAAVTFYYPRLGNLTDVTLALFHVDGFQIVSEGDRWRIGNIGGPGGSSPLYRHSHIEFYRGNTGLPAPGMRASLRIDPATIFPVTQ